MLQLEFTGSRNRNTLFSGDVTEKYIFFNREFLDLHKYFATQLL